MKRASHRQSGLIAGVILVLAVQPAFGQTTYTWNGTSSAWTAAANWTPSRSTPLPDDVMVIDGSLTAVANITNLPTQTIGQLSVINGAQVSLSSVGAVNLILAGGTGTDLTVDSGALLALVGSASSVITLTLNAGVTGSVLGTMTSGASSGSAPNRILPTDPGSLVFGPGSSFRTNAGHTGNIFGNSGSSGVAVFQSGSVYRQFAGANPFATTGGRCVFQTGSLYRQESIFGLSISGRTYADVEIDMGSFLSFVGSSNSPCTMDHLAVLSGGFLMSIGTGTTGSLNLRGNLSIAPGALLVLQPTFPANYALRMIGTAPQTIAVAPGGYLSLNGLSTLDIANATGVSLLSDVRVGGPVTLTSGNLSTGINTLRLLSSASITPGANWVNGRMAWEVSAGSGTYAFPVGDASTSAAVSLDLTGVTSPCTLAVQTTAGDLPLAGSGLLASRSVNRSWSVETDGPAASFAFADVTLNYPSGDLDGGVTPANLAVGKLDGALWTQPAHGAGTSTSITATGVTGFSSFVVAEAADDAVAAVPAGCISTVTPCVAVPVVWTRTDGTPARAASVTVELSPNLTLCGAQATDGGYLLPGAGGVSLHVVPLGGNQYTVDLATLGAPCGATGNGTLFNLLVSSASPTGTGTITVTDVVARDCANAPIPAAAGLMGSIPIDQAPPAGVTLAAAQRKTGNSAAPSGTTDIQLSYSAPEAGTSVTIYRKGFGGYPDYDDAGGTAPAAPATPAAALLAGWAATAVASSGDFDRVAARDFYYYVAFVTDGCGNVSPVSNLTGGTLNYHLGDVHDGIANCAGNNLVTTSDISALGFNYGATGIPVGGALECLDVGPTTDFSVDGRPTTDHRLQFEDLILYAINYGQVSAPQTRALPALAAANDLRLSVPPLPGAGATFAVPLMFSGAGDLQGFTATLDYDRSVVEFTGVEAGPLLARQPSTGMALTPAAGTVDIALLGTGAALRGEGEIARAIFRVRRAGDAAITLGSAEGRDGANRARALGDRSQGDRPALPAVDALAPARPMPFRDRTTLEFALARAGGAELAIYTVQGRRIRTLVHGERAAGVHRETWDGRDDGGRIAPPGVYFVRLVTAGVRASRTLIRVP